MNIEEKYTSYFQKRSIGEKYLEKHRNDTTMSLKVDSLIRNGYEFIVGGKTFQAMDKAIRGTWIETLYNQDIRELALTCNIDLRSKVGLLILSIDRSLYVCMTTKFGALKQIWDDYDIGRKIHLHCLHILETEICYENVLVSPVACKIDTNNREYITKEQYARIGVVAKSAGMSIWTKIRRIHRSHSAVFIEDYTDEEYQKLYTTVIKDPESKMDRLARYRKVDKALASSVAILSIRRTLRERNLERLVTSEPVKSEFVEPIVREHFLERDEEYDA
jgi:hypothetical protein